MPHLLGTMHIKGCASREQCAPVEHGRRRWGEEFHRLFGRIALFSVGRTGSPSVRVRLRPTGLSDEKSGNGLMDAQSPRTP